MTEKGDFVIAVKDNQRKRLQEIREFFSDHLEQLRYREYETADVGHGRIDESADGRETHDVRYDILRRTLSGPRFGEAVRGHWGIESMHWVLDVNFREDDSRTRERTLGNNLSWLRRFAISRLKHHPLKESLRGKMQIAGWNDDFLAEVLTGQQL